MTFLQKLFQKALSAKSAIEYKRSKRPTQDFQREASIEYIRKHYKSRYQMYQFFHHYFWNVGPDWLRNHREYFKADFRGFGEDAFHAMWYHIFKEFKPKNALEIGIYRGQVISLWGLICDQLKIDTQISGISPFSPAGDHVSVYLRNIDYHSDVLKNYSAFSTTIKPELHKGFSTDPKMIALIRSRAWDLIYIDGNHDYEIVKQDFAVCSESLNKHGLIVLDDSALYTDYAPPSYSTAGHPGPSKLAQEIDPNSFEEILYVGHNRVFQKIG